MTPQYSGMCLAKSASFAGFGDTPLLDTPASVSVITEAQLKDQQARLLSDVIKNDASIGENYAPVGYYENISVRGFPLDLASGYRINGLSAVGEQNIALENKEQVEIIKGLAGLNKDGLPAAWLHRTVAPSITALFAPRPRCWRLRTVLHGRNRCDRGTQNLFRPC